MKSPRTWLPPVVVVTLLMSLLSFLYLDSVLKPEQNLHGFPIALVQQDDGEVVTDKTGTHRVNFGEQVKSGLLAALGDDKFDVRQVGISQAQQQLTDAQVYGAIVIPADFSKRLMILAQGSVIPGDIERPALVVNTNPGVGAFATGIVERLAQRLSAEVNKTVGTQLTQRVNETLAQTPPGVPSTQTSGAARLTLAAPVNVAVAPFHPLPEGTGNGLSAFFLTVLLLLAGFTGAMIVHTLIDSALGFAPTEYGPWYVHFPAAPVSRLRTLLLKWAAMLLTSLIVMGAYTGIGAALGMPMEHGLLLYLFGSLAILAVGVTALSVLAALGSSGLLVNLVLFIVLGLPSSGGTVPIEASPKLFGWLAEFVPMHQVFLGVRAILYFEGRGNAGLITAAWMALLGLLIGVGLGLSVTRFYDRKGLERRPMDHSRLPKVMGKKDSDHPQEA